MIAFVGDKWYKLKENRDNNALVFVSDIPNDRKGYFDLWAKESSVDSKNATKILPFSGHETGVYMGCTILDYMDDAPVTIKYESKITQSL